MKKIFLILAMLMVMVSCATKDDGVKHYDFTNKENVRFIEVERCDYYYSIVYDKETMVMYVRNIGGYEGGIFSPLFDKDGKPLLYKGNEY